MTHIRNSRMADMYKAGQTMQQIGEQFGVTKQCVSHILRKAGVASGRRWRPLVEIEDEIILLIKSRCKYRDIAKKYGVSLGGVAGIARRNGLSIHDAPNVDDVLSKLPIKGAPRASGKKKAKK